MLVNRSTGDLLANHLTRCDTFWRRLRGLMCRRPLDPGEVYLFGYRREGIVESSVHTLFVFFPIALLWLDGHQRVVDVRLAKPFRLYYAPQRAASYLVEGLPELLGRVRVGDELEF